MEKDAVAEAVRHLFLQCDARHLAQALTHGGIAPDGQLALVAARVHGRRHHAHHPYRTQQMIAVRVGENQVVDLCKFHARLFQLA